MGQRRPADKSRSRSARTPPHRSLHICGPGTVEHIAPIAPPVLSPRTTVARSGLLSENVRGPGPRAASAAATTSSFAGSSRQATYSSRSRLEESARSISSRPTTMRRPLQQRSRASENSRIILCELAAVNCLRTSAISSVSINLAVSSPTGENSALSCARESSAASRLRPLFLYVIR
jgi:hypothetical protein